MTKMFVSTSKPNTGQSILDARRACAEGLEQAKKCSSLTEDKKAIALLAKAIAFLALAQESLQPPPAELDENGRPVKDTNGPVMTARRVADRERRNPPGKFGVRIQNPPTRGDGGLR